MAKKVIWADIHKRGGNVTPTYYFDFDFLNHLGFADSEMLSFLEEMKAFAEKEMKERAEKKGSYSIIPHSPQTFQKS